MMIREGPTQVTYNSNQAQSHLAATELPVETAPDSRLLILSSLDASNAGRSAVTGTPPAPPPVLPPFTTPLIVASLPSSLISRCPDGR